MPVYENDASNDIQLDEDFNQRQDPTTFRSPVSFLQLFRFASTADKVLIGAGMLASIIIGFSTPATNFIIAVIANVVACYLKYVNMNINSKNYTTSNDISGCINFTSEITPSSSVLKCTYLSGDETYVIVRNCAIAVAIIAAINLIFGYVRVASLNRAAITQEYKIRCLYLKSVLRQDVAWFDSKRSGELVINSIEYSQKYRDGVGDNLGRVLSVSISCVTSLILAFIYGWKLTLVCLSCFPALIVCGGVYARISATRAEFEIEAQASAGNIVQEVLSALKTVVAFGGEAKETEKYSEHLEIARKACIKRSATASIFNGLTRFATFASLGLGYWYGLRLMANEFCLPNPHYDAFVLTIVIFNVVFSCMEIGRISPEMLAISEAKYAASFIYSIIDKVPLIDSLSEDGIFTETMNGDISFNSVHFNYPERPYVKVLNGLSLKVNAGETLAIVGESGCGKTTITQLIQRFYDPLQGEVTIDGMNVKEINIGWLRTNIGVVGQEPVLFSTTIAENIRFGKEGATQKDIEDAAKDAFAHDFIMKLPDKYETQVGERGSQLSGGQKQRIAIARALIRNPKILLLDEATSALDYESKVVVLEALKKAAIGRTTIVITHYLSVVREAEQICVMLEGQIAEFGNHQKLMESGGIYSNLVKKQEEQMNAQEGIVALRRNNEISIVDDLDAMNSKTYLPYREVAVDAGSSRNGSFNSFSRSSSRLKSGCRSNIPTTTSVSVTDDSGTPRLKLDSKVKTGFLLRLLNEVLPDLKYIMLGVIASMISGCMMPVVVTIIGKSYDVMIITEEATFNAKSRAIGLAFLTIAAVGGIILMLQNLLFAISGENLTMRLRIRTFRAIMRQEMAWFDDPSSNVGEICTNLLYDAANVRNAIRTAAEIMIEYGATIIASILLCCILNWKLGLLFVASLPIFIAAHKFQSSIVHRITKWELNINNKSNKVAIEALSKFRTIASLHREKAIINKYELETKKVLRAGIRTANVQGLMHGLIESTVWCVVASIIFYGVVLITQNAVAFSDFFIIQRVTFVMAMFVGRFISMNSSIEKGLISAKRLFETFDRKSAIDPYSTTGNQLPMNAHEAAQLTDVHFCYPSRVEVEILKGIHLTVYKGQQVGLAGSSGCGKSTIFHLLLRMYDPQKGIVNYAGEDVKKLNTRSLRSDIAIVSQEPILFDRTIEENIAYGDLSRKVPYEEVVAAARAANIHNFVSMLPDGYNTKVGDKGTFLSGGQKQRIAIARALIRNPKVLFLDEATSALDTENEKIVQDALAEAQVGRTSIVVTHRLSTIANCDVIFAIQDGKVVEVGNHDELMKRKGYYYRLYELSTNPIGSNK